MSENRKFKCEEYRGKRLLSTHRTLKQCPLLAMSLKSLLSLMSLMSLTLKVRDL
jgi:hypothetical protein